MVNTSGTISTIVGTGTGGFPETVARPPVPKWALCRAWGWMQAANLYIADTSNYRVRVAGSGGRLQLLLSTA